MDGQGFIRNSNRGRQVKRNNEKNTHIYIYRKKLREWKFKGVEGEGKEKQTESRAKSTQCGPGKGGQA